MNEKERNEMWKAMMPVTRKALSERAIEMRPTLNEKQVVESVNRTMTEFVDEEPSNADELLMRLEFHADDVLGHGDEEYAYTGDEEPKRVTWFTFTDGPKVKKNRGDEE